MARGSQIALSASARAMKIQEIILKAMSGEIKWCKAAGIIGVSGRQMRRWKRRYDEHGYKDFGPSGGAEFLNMITSDPGLHLLCFNISQ